MSGTTRAAMNRASGWTGPGWRARRNSSLPVRTIGGDPDREVEEMVLLLHEKQREILNARLDALEALTQISALVRPRQPDELYSLKPR
ncbi:MAG: hypothetical protein H7332_11710 [Bdellovibrionales bacterium]|nr:hypothetical protein [Ramlibacter sp.]